MTEDPNPVSSKPVVVRGYIMLGTHIGVFLLRLLFFLIVSVALERKPGNEEADLVLLVVFGTTWALMEICYFAAIFSRASVLDTGDGFEYRTWFSRRHFRDEQVVGFAPLPNYPDFVACVFKPKEDGDDLHQVPLPKHAPNYMPGYHLLSKLVAETGNHEKEPEA